MSLARFRVVAVAGVVAALGACGDLTTEPTATALDAPGAPAASTSSPELGGSVTLDRITFESRHYSSGFPGSTPAALSAFANASTTTPGYTNGPIVLPSLVNISNAGLIGGRNDNLAYRVRISVTSTGTSVAAFRFGADFGWGGTLLLDGVEVQARWSDMWWNGAFTNPSQYLQGILTLTPGTHLIELYGFEGCCDGAMTGELDVGNGGEIIEIGTFEPADPTAPVIVPVIAGVEGSSGWFVSDVDVSWNVTDAESPAAITLAGCTPLSLTTDTPGVLSSCGASSPGGTAPTRTVQVKRDATAPSIVFSGATSYTVDQTVAITCTVTDATSGVESATCPAAAGAATGFALGIHTLAASATDHAGNSANATTTFTVGVTSGSLCALTTRFVSQAGIARSMCKQLENGAIGAYQNHVRAQSGKSVSSANAAMLITLADGL